jgi:hypothetical protein
MLKIFKTNSYILFGGFLLAFFLLVTGCHSIEKNPKPENMIPGDKLSSIFTKMYLADGLLTNPNIRDEFEYKDSVQNYMDIIESYGYTKNDFEETISYLFINNPKKLQAAYDKSLAELSRMDAELKKEKDDNNKESALRNYYTGKPNISLPNDGVTNKIEVDIPIDRPGQYILKTRVLLYEDDQSIKPFINLWYWYDDGTPLGHIEPWDTLWLEKKSQSQLITHSKLMVDSLATNIRGFLFDHTDQPGHWEKHANFSNITFTWSEKFQQIHRNIDK